MGKRLSWRLRLYSTKQICYSVRRRPTWYVTQVKLWQLGKKRSVVHVDDQWYNDSFLLNFYRATTMDYSRPSGLPRRLHSGTSSTSTCAVVLRVASLLSALLALAAKENGIAALPIAISWDMIRLHQQQQSTWHHDDDRSGRTRSKTSSSK